MSAGNNTSCSGLDLAVASAINLHARPGMQTDTGCRNSSWGYKIHEEHQKAKSSPGEQQGYSPTDWQSTCHVSRQLSALAYHVTAAPAVVAVVVVGILVGAGVGDGYHH